MANLKKFEDYDNIDIVDKSELDNTKTWSPRHVIYTRQGLKAFKKVGYTLTEVTVLNRASDKNLIYMTQENADMLNGLGNSISDRIELYNQQLEEVTKNTPDSDSNIGRDNGNDSRLG